MSYVDIKKVKIGKMAKNNIFCIILGLSYLFYLNPAAFAANTASQTVSAQLDIVRQVVANGGNTSSTIQPNGNLTTAISPQFKILCNTSLTQYMKMEATITDSSGAGIPAVYGDGTTNYIILAHTRPAPTPASIADIIAGSSNPANNPNAIAFHVTNPADVPGKLKFIWNPAKYWDAELTSKGETFTYLTIPAGIAAPNTFSIQDLDGEYVTVIVFTFI